MDTESWPEGASSMVDRVPPKGKTGGSLGPPGSDASEFLKQGSHKNLKTKFHDFSMTDLLLSMTPILTWFQIWL